MFERLTFLLFSGAGVVGGVLDKLGFNPKRFRLRYIFLLPILMILVVLLGLGWLFHGLNKIW